MDRSIQELTWEHDAIIDSSSDGLFVCDGQGVILRVNPASERINQARADQLVGRHYLDAAKDGLVILPSAALSAIEQRRQVSLLQENRFGRKLISTATPVFDENGDIVRVVVSERDITEIDRLQRQLEEQQALGDTYRRQVLELQQQLLADQPVIARSPVMQQTLRQALRVAEVDSTVLLLGESGVGKELIADLIHQHSGRCDKPMIKLNCGAIPETLIEAELFGYEKGAFTGAVGRRPGYLEQADGGILFLDEVGELPAASQVKLLRFLEDGRVTRLGSTTARSVDVRIIAATHRDLKQMVDAGRFRLDLYYRLSVIPIGIPPLRERRECLVPLLQHFIGKFADRAGVRRQLSVAALEQLLRYDYPGNVRELSNICERLVVMSETEQIEVGDLPHEVMARARAVSGEVGGWPPQMTLAQILASIERQVLWETAQRCRTQQEIAEALGMSQSNVARKLDKYGIRARYGRG
ncbi:MAG: sigma 54-interacting transcriptional regulator [Geothermobacteraceae bacterium]